MGEIKEIVEVIGLDKDVLILIIILFTAFMFYLIQLNVSNKKTKYANGQVLRLMKGMPLMGLLNIIRDWIKSRKNTS
ncbi:hypothetical protein ACFO3O_17165 [Dokdonia ponticola]|uniref:Uncharacterized protein n=1 Tax=Dokdonia ponticola TaxID=2041041 RepID=A0ABV9I331_9FLAO